MSAAAISNHEGWDFTEELVFFKNLNVQESACSRQKMVSCHEFLVLMNSKNTVFSYNTFSIHTGQKVTVVTVWYMQCMDY